MDTKVSFLLIIFLFVVSFYSQICVGYPNNCDCPTSLVQLSNGYQTGIISQASGCFQACTIVAENYDSNREIRIHFDRVPNDIQVQIYDGKKGNNLVQNCYPQNGTECYSTGNLITFYFTPVATVTPGNRMEITLEPYNAGISQQPKPHNCASLSFISLIFTFCVTKLFSQ